MMKRRTRKLVTFTHLITIHVVLFLNQIQAEAFRPQEESLVSETRQSVAEPEFAKQQREQEIARITRQTELSSREAETSAAAINLPEIDEASSKIGFFTQLGQVASSLTNLGKTGVINVADFSLEKMGQAWNGVKSVIKSAYENLLKLLPLAARLDPETRAAFNLVLGQAKQLREEVWSLAQIGQQNIGNASQYEFLKEPEKQNQVYAVMQEDWKKLNDRVIQLNQAVARFIENSDPAHADTKQIVDQVKEAQTDVLGAVRGNIDYLIGPSDTKENRNEISRRYGVLMVDINQLRPGVKIET